jgi:uncharacterized protein (DUF488 family)
MMSRHEGEWAVMKASGPEGGAPDRGVDKPPLIMTIGHSTRSAEQFLALLQAHGITGIADVRKMPGSRRHPHFAREALSAFLAAHRIAYEHFPGLGGLRKPLANSRNTGWRHPSFRAYADHMASAEFQTALEHLLNFSQKFVAAVMCAESQWWQCHRQLIADALVARGIEVRHIMSATSAPAHELTSFARVTGPEVWYPGLV